MLAGATVAPVFVKSESLMGLWLPKRGDFIIETSNELWNLMARPGVATQFQSYCQNNRPTLFTGEIGQLEGFRIIEPPLLTDPKDWVTWARRPRLPWPRRSVAR